MRKTMSDETKSKIKESHNALCAGNRVPPTNKMRLKALKSDLKNRYGISLDQYNEMLVACNNACTICKQAETAISRFGTPKRLTIDHCHDTGQIRGILCEKCNRGLGYFKNSIESLLSAAEYLKLTQ